MVCHKCATSAPLSGSAVFLFCTMPRHIYLDESGDTGWKFDKPYNGGGSSRYLTIGYLVVPENDRFAPKRCVRKVYDKFRFGYNVELKGSEMLSKHRDYACEKILSMFEKKPEYQLGAITVKKEHVSPVIRADANMLYNYMIRKAVLPKIDKAPKAFLYRDERTIKMASGNSCIDYLKTTLAFDHNSSTVLYDKPAASHENLSVMLIDWITHFVWSKYEKNDTGHCDNLSSILHDETLFF